MAALIWVNIETGGWCGGMVSEGGRITEAAPFLRKNRGRPSRDVVRGLLRNHAEVQWLDLDKPGEWKRVEKNS